MNHAPAITYAHSVCQSRTTPIAAAFSDVTTAYVAQRACEDARLVPNVTDAMGQCCQWTVNTFDALLVQYMTSLG